MSDSLIRHLTTAAVLLVAAIAAVISYQHLYHLAITHGETRLDAALLPLSIDGTVVTASLLMLLATRRGLRTPWLARGMLVAAVVMTVAANVAFGWRWAAWGVLMAGWPAAAFLMNAEGSISFGRKSRTVTAVRPRARADTLTSAGTTPGQPGPDTASGSAAARARTVTVPSGRLTAKQEAAMRDVSVRTIYRERQAARQDDRVAAMNGNGRPH